MKLQDFGTLTGLLDFLEDESGSELAEYALAVSLFGVAAIVGLGAIAVVASTRQTNLQTNLTNSGAVAP